MASGQHKIQNHAQVAESCDLHLAAGCNLRRALWALACAALLFLAAGCEKKAPSVDQKFVNAYVEMLVAENMYGKSSTTAMVKRQNILKEAGYTRETFLKKANSILDDRDMWVPFQRAVVARLDSLIEEGNKDKEKGPKRKRGED